APEKTKLSAALDKLEARLTDVIVKEVSKSGEDVSNQIANLEKAVNARFIYLHQSIERVGKKDFLLLAYAALITVFMDGLFPAESRPHFIAWLAGELSALVHLIGLSS
ncbi:MAG: hypothetical protein JO332_02915, partial [Planctomycetaceae bacterium]|nr:hypothetical protein [Planctomycetaceae bacterium]